MDTKSCFFVGHREASEEIYSALYAAVEQHILEYGVTEFIVGHYGGFDRLAASAVKEAKRFYPEVRLTLLLPYHPAERPISTPDGFDGTFYPPGMEGVPRKVAIVRANRYVVDLSLIHIYGGPGRERKAENHRDAYSIQRGNCSDRHRLSG